MINTLTKKSVYIIFMVIVFVFLTSYSDVVFDGKTIAKKDILVFLFIGHSNMAGRVSLDKNTHDRCWNYKIDQPNHQWVKARDIIHHEGYDTDCEGKTKGSPAMRIVKKLAAEFPCKYFGILQNAHAQATIRGPAGSSCIPTCGNKQYQKGGCLYQEIVEAGKEIKDEVTFGGAVVMLGILESHNRELSASFAEDLKKMITHMRAELGAPNMPLIIGKFEESSSAKGSHWKVVHNHISNLPSIITHTGVVNSEGPYLDPYHYNEEGYQRFANTLATLIKSKKWIQCGAVAEDKQPPRAPGNLKTTNHTYKSVSLRWNASSDNIGVVAYDIYSNGNLITSVGGEITETDVTGLKSSTTYDFTVKSRDAAGNISLPSNTVSVVTDKRTLDFVQIPFSVNVGGQEEAGFAADKEFTQHGDYGYLNTPGGTASTTACAEKTITGTSHNHVYSCIRHKDFSYHIRVHSGTYTVTIHMAEFWLKKGKRVFDCFIEGKKLTSEPIDIVALAGFAQPLTCEKTVNVTDSLIDITFEKSTYFPMISGISVQRTNAVTVLSPNGDESYNQGDTMTIRWKADTTLLKEVLIELSVNNGKTWFSILESRTISTMDKTWGAYPWVINPTIGDLSTCTDNARITVRGYETDEPADQSDKAFSITGCPEGAVLYGFQPTSDNSDFQIRHIHNRFYTIDSKKKQVKALQSFIDISGRKIYLTKPNLYTVPACGIYLILDEDKEMRVYRIPFYK